VANLLGEPAGGTGCPLHAKVGRGVVDPVGGTRASTGERTAPSAAAAAAVAIAAPDVPVVLAAVQLCGPRRPRAEHAHALLVRA
jgi:hypothetical protein